ncbi:hypothetical protein DACRYDRAFT_103751 [Dacryopinax primogenitus]|uniref:Uncharacterized protein n=1 Tax=Dacryopinax primogenitus (strain DJM 731) TaxID=1858805 RepID=M5GGC7_DACPD|nr:uncharacterized protein DACRYDRAFT_103751 [Dacryopinax primogenitus]EJU05258.1 hypothetical protein DACRYDRAFT_103751 [Dacryopinax primogenitus]
MFRSRWSATFKNGRTGCGWQEHLKGLIKAHHQQAAEAVDLEARGSTRPMLIDSRVESDYEDVEDKEEEGDEEQVLGGGVGVLLMHQEDAVGNGSHTAATPTSMVGMNPPTVNRSNTGYASILVEAVTSNMCNIAAVLLTVKENNHETDTIQASMGDICTIQMDTSPGTGSAADMDGGENPAAGRGGMSSGVQAGQ